jgi:uncharacterized protein YkwD
MMLGPRGAPVALAFVAVVLAGSCSGGVPERRTGGAVRTAVPFTTENALSLVNAYRGESGLSPLRVDAALMEAARRHSLAMQAAGRMSHDVGEDFSTRLAAAGVVGRAAAENVAWGQRSLSEVMEGWKRSPGHAANLRNGAVTRIGIAEAGTYWTLILAGD